MAMMDTLTPAPDRQAHLSRVESFVLNLTDVCNIACTYCFEAKSREKLEHHDNFSELLNTIAETAHLKPAGRRLNIAFYGGEPLSAFHTIERTVTELCERVGAHAFKFRIATNGVLLKGRIREFLIKHDFAVQVSLDGPAHVIDVHRIDHAGKGTSHRLQHIVDNVKIFPEITARLTVTPSISKYFSECIAYLISIGFDTPARNIKFDFDFSATWCSGALDAFHQECEKCATFLADHYKAGGRARVDPLDRVLQNHRPEASRCGKGGYCGAGCSAIHVSPQMEFYTCNRLTPSHSAEHASLKLSSNALRFDRLNDILNEIHPGIERKPECETCQARHYCEQTCPARIHSSSGSFSKISDENCRLIRETHYLGRRVRARMITQPQERRQSFEEVYELTQGTAGNASGIGLSGF